MFRPSVGCCVWPTFINPARPRRSARWDCAPNGGVGGMAEGSNSQWEFKNRGDVLFGVIFSFLRETLVSSCAGTGVPGRGMLETQKAARMKMNVFLNLLNINESKYPADYLKCRKILRKNTSFPVRTCVFSVQFSTEKTLLINYCTSCQR